MERYAGDSPYEDYAEDHWSDYEEIGRLRAVNVKLVAAIEAVEWIGDEFGEFCPWCNARKPNGHRADCLRRAARQAEEE